MFVSPESRWRDLFNCLFVFLVVGVIGFGFDGLLVREGIPRLAILLLSNALTGIAVALLYFSIVETDGLLLLFFVVIGVGYWLHEQLIEH